MQEVGKRIGAVAGTDVSVLIQGESGTGKELIARAIHAASARREGPFEPIDCAALPPELVESELYGHERGAFTGALKGREGRIRRAHGGTLFLDEVGELPLPAQAKLLRFLAERELSPVGGEGRVAVDVRVIAATNRPLERAVKDGSFREDLFYRLNVFAIHAPPLRERKGDIPDLARRFLARAGRGPGGAAPLEPTPEALALLARHDWPGNVRELRNAVEHASVVARGAALLPEHLPAYIQIAGEAPPVPVAASSRAPGAPDPDDLAATLLDAAIASGGAAPGRAALERFERALIEVAMRRSRGSISGAARLLGMQRTTVRARLREGERREDPPAPG
jgi:DNA-binding NtrC family response regulator